MSGAAAVHPQRQHLALDRPHRRPPVRRQPGNARDQAPAASTTISAATLCRRRARRPSRGRPARDLLDRPVLVERAAGGHDSDAQRLHQLAVVDLMVLRGEHRAGDVAGEMRLARRVARGRQPFERQTELALKIQALSELGLVVARSARGPACPPRATRRRCRSRAEAPRRSRASAPGSRGRARPAPLRRAPPRSRRRACRRRRGSRRSRPRRARKWSTDGAAGEPPGDRRGR